MRSESDDFQKAWAEFEKSREDLRHDIPGFVDIIDKHEAIVRLRINLMERSLHQIHDERAWIIKAGVVTAAVSVLFPPFHWGGYRGGQSIGLGHSFILSPPVIASSNNQLGSIDAIGLIAILAGITLVTWAATLVRWKK